MAGLADGDRFGSPPAIKILRGGPGGGAGQTGENVRSLREIFERWKSATKRADGTYDTRSSALNTLARGGIVAVEQAVDPRTVAAYIEARGAAGAKERTILKEVNTITVLLRYLVKTRELERSVFDAILELCPKPKKGKKFSAEVLTDEECEAIYLAARALGYIQTALAIKIVQYAGLRTSEFLGLCVEHIDFKHKHIVVRPDKRVKGIRGHKTGERLVPIVRELLPILQQSIPASGPLFPCTRHTSTGRTVKCGETLREGLRRAAKIAGVTKTIDFKIFRRTRETTWAAIAGMPRNYLGIIMGHDPTTGEEVYQRVHAGYNPVCETPAPNRTTKVMKQPAGWTPTRTLTPAEVAELQALERALLARRREREAT